MFIRYYAFYHSKYLSEQHCSLTTPSPVFFMRDVYCVSPCPSRPLDNISLSGKPLRSAVGQKLGFHIILVCDLAIILSSPLLFRIPTQQHGMIEGTLYFILLISLIWFRINGLG